MKSIYHKTLVVETINQTKKSQLSGIEKLLPLQLCYKVHQRKER